VLPHGCITFRGGTLTLCPPCVTPCSPCGTPAGAHSRRGAPWIRSPRDAARSEPSPRPANNSRTQRLAQHERTLPCTVHAATGVHHVVALELRLGGVRGVGVLFGGGLHGAGLLVAAATVVVGAVVVVSCRKPQSPVAARSVAWDRMQGVQRSDALPPRAHARTLARGRRDV
jgi:hypothetical protein